MEDNNNVVSVNIEGAKLDGEFKENAIDPNSRKDSNGVYPEAEEEVRNGPAADGRGRSGLRPGAARHLKGEYDEHLKRDYKASEPADNTVWLLMFYLLVTVGLLVGLWFLFGKFRESFFSGGLTGGFSKSGARL